MDVAEIKRRREQMIAAYEVDVLYNKDLAVESLRGDELHLKYLKLYDEARRYERHARHYKSSVRRSLFGYYRGWYNGNHAELSALQRGPFEYALHPKEVEFWVTSDPLWIDSANLHSEAEEWASDMEEILEKIKNRHWSIQNFLKYKALQAGL